jgi:hypothetical protein
MPHAMLRGMRTRISTTVNHEWLTAARKNTGLPDSELIDLALSALLERAERDAEDRAFAETPYELDPDLAGLPSGWSCDAPPLDAYDGSVPDDVVALFTARNKG